MLVPGQPVGGLAHLGNPELLAPHILLELVKLALENLEHTDYAYSHHLLTNFF